MLGFLLSYMLFGMFVIQYCAFIITAFSLVDLNFLRQTSVRSHGPTGVRDLIFLDHVYFPGDPKWMRRFGKCLSPALRTILIYSAVFLVFLVEFSFIVFSTSKCLMPL